MSSAPKALSDHKSSGHPVCSGGPPHPETLDVVHRMSSSLIPPKCCHLLHMAASPSPLGLAWDRGHPEPQPACVLTDFGGHKPCSIPPPPCTSASPPIFTCWETVPCIKFVPSFAQVPLTLQMLLQVFSQPNFLSILVDQEWSQTEASLQGSEEGTLRAFCFTTPALIVRSLFPQKKKKAPKKANNPQSPGLWGRGVGMRGCGVVGGDEF